MLCKTRLRQTVSRGVVELSAGHPIRRHWPDQSACDCQEAVTAALDRPFIVPFEQDCVNQSGDGLIGKDSDDFHSALEGTVDEFERMVECSLARYGGRKAHAGQHVGLGLIREDGELGQLGAQLTGPLRRWTRAARCRPGQTRRR